MTHVTIYRSATARHPIARDEFESFGAWCDELEAMINEPPECDEDAPRDVQKEAMLAWSPHCLRATCECGSCSGAPHRLLVNVEAVTMLVLDVDAIVWRDEEHTRRHAQNPHDDALSLLIEAAERESESGLVYESPSSAPGAERVRVVVPIDRELAPSECRASRIAFAHALGLAPSCGVLGAIDAAKLFFAGRLHGTPDRRVWRW